MTDSLFEYGFTLRLHDTDAAGVIYFARLMQRAHEAYEAFLDANGLPLADLIAQGPALPLVHAEADFLAPIRLGQALRVRLQAAEIGRSSFTLEYLFVDLQDRPLARARTVHVALAAGNGTPIDLPQALRTALDGAVIR